MPVRSIRRGGALVAALGIASLAISSCGAGGGEGTTQPSEFSVLINSENPDVPAVLRTLAEDQCSSENEALPLAVETIPQTKLDQKLQLLAGQDGLPVMFAAGNAPSLTKTLAESGHILDLEKALKGTGALDNFEPAAVSTIKSLYGGLRVMPFEYNIEGIWYNKALFAEHGVNAPKTWNDLITAAETFKEAGIIPFSVSGEQGWPITRYIGNYIYRDLGPEALQRVADGEASLTDPEYVKAAEKVASLGESGYFGKGVGSISMDTSTNMFLNGSAAMFYMGSWALADFNDPKRNEIGSENIGFMPFPAVTGGAGDRQQLAANVGLPLAINAKSYNQEVENWLTCISEHYGSVALKQANQVSGFSVNTPVKTSRLVDLVREQIEATDETVLWFEANFTTEATTTSQNYAAPLVTGNTSPQQFMELIQNDLDS